MSYILDTGFFALSREYYPDIFPTFWRNMDDACKKGIIVSVHEVKKELERYGGNQQHLTDWIESNSNIFTKPSEEEQRNIRKIFANEKTQGLIAKNKMLEGGPFADPFVIAKAMLAPNNTVVMKELPAKRDKNNNIQGALKIPDVCSLLNVNCITPEEFMQELNWKF